MFRKNFNNIFNFMYDNRDSVLRTLQKNNIPLDGLDETFKFLEDAISFMDSLDFDEYIEYGDRAVYVAFYESDEDEDNIELIKDSYTKFQIWYYTTHNLNWEQEQLYFYLDSTIMYFFELKVIQNLYLRLKLSGRA